MHRLQLCKADDPVKLRQHAVDVPGDIVARVGDVAGVQTDAHLFPQLRAVDDLPQLLEAAAHLRALAGHGLQQHRGAVFRPEDGVEGLRDLADARLHPLLRVAAGVEVVVVPRQIFHALQVVRQRHPGKLPGALCPGAGVDGVGRVGHQQPEAVFRQQRPQRRRVVGVDGLGLAAPGIAGEKLECIGADIQRRPPHGQKAVGGGEVTADRQHGVAPFRWPASPRPLCRFRW